MPASILPGRAVDNLALYPAALQHSSAQLAEPAPINSL